MKNNNFGNKLYRRVQQISPILILITTIVIIFIYKEKITIWEDTGFYSVLAYTLVLYLAGLFGNKFDGLKKKQPWIILSLIIFILIITTSIIKKELLIWEAPLERTHIMLLYLLIVLLFIIINCILIKANVPEKGELKNSLKYNEFPIFIAFLLLTSYAWALGDEKIKELGIDPLLSGAIGISLLTSNIIWGIIDNNQYFINGD